MAANTTELEKRLWDAADQLRANSELKSHEYSVPVTKPDITLTKQEAAEVKKVAKALLEKLKQEKLVLDWRKQQTTRAMVLVTIKDILNDQLPRAYSKELYTAKCDVVYQHFYDAYSGQGKSVYASNG